MIINNVISIKDPKSSISEAYRTLRSNIQFSTYDNNLKTILVTSSEPGEGKTTISANLAATFSQTGKKTIILDCDLRRPTMHKLFGISNEKGLTNILIGEETFETVVRKIDQDFLHVLTSGVKPPNPAELLSSRRMHNFVELLKTQYDYIIFDTPPIVMVTDAQIISQYAEGCILVVSSGEVDKDAARKAKELLEKVNAKILGVVLNKLDVAKYKGYYEYYYHEYYSEDGTKIKKKKSKKKSASV